jgi:hypothetical protein
MNTKSIGPEVADIVVTCARRAIPSPKQQSLTDHEFVCAQIRQAEYCPLFPQRAALTAIVTPSAFRTDPDLSEQIAAEQLARFCEDFFSLAPKIRTTRWNSLQTTLKGYPQLLWRLNALKPGLKVVLPESASESTKAKLVQLSSQLFVMSPAQAARQLRSFCEEIRTDQKSSVTTYFVMKELRNPALKLAELVPPAILPLSLRLQRDRALRYGISVLQRPARLSWGAPGRVASAVIFVCIVIIRVSGVFNDRHDSSHNAPYRNYSPQNSYQAQYQQDLYQRALRQQPIQNSSQEPVKPPTLSSPQFITSPLQATDTTEFSDWLDSQEKRLQDGSQPDRIQEAAMELDAMNDIDEPFSTFAPEQGKLLSGSFLQSSQRRKLPSEGSKELDAMQQQLEESIRKMR